MSPGGRIRESDIEAVRERTDIVQVISEYVPLKRAGREFRGPCPFHQEKDPSFYVNPAKDVFFCHGCKAGGNVINFVMQMEGLNFAETIEKLADRLGYQLTYDASSPDEVKGRLEKDRLYKLNQTAADFFHYTLVETPGARAALDYLSGRGFESSIIEEYKLGFAPPGWDNLSGFLGKKGFKEKEITTVGLARERSSGGTAGGRNIYDMFRNRIIFPILDHRGRVVAFSARQMPDDSDGPKYINSPETPVYRKGNVLYGFYQARQGIQDSREAVVVEGQTDLLSVRQAGVLPVVAPLGTALTEHHFEMLGKFCDRVYLSFDADRAGFDAAQRVLEFFNRFGLEIFVMTLPAGEDPATLIEKGGAEAFLSIKQAAEPLLDFSVARIIESSDTSTVMARQNALRACVPVLTRVAGDEMRPVRDELVRRISSLLEIPEETVQIFARNALRPPGAQGRDQTDPGRVSVMSDKVETEAMRLLLHEPRALIDQQHLDVDFFMDPVNKKIMAILKDFPICDEEFLQVEYDAFLRQQTEAVEDENVRRRIMELLVESPPECSRGYENTVFDRLMLMFLKRRKQKVEADIRNANKRLEPKKYDTLCEQLLELQQLIREQFPYDHS
jgi:DNA primase